jgi:hypothetical protein
VLVCIINASCGSRPQSSTLKEMTEGTAKTSVEKMAEVPIRQDLLQSGANYEGGLYAKDGPNTYFVIEEDKLKHENHLYWIKVKLLSEKYGCFIVNKKQSGASTLFRCRDTRRVLMHESRSESQAQVHSRQFDKRGRLLTIRNHKVVAMGH